MTTYTPNDAFTTPVQRYDISDLVLGGATGPSSLPIEQLADRTQYLGNRLGGFKNVSTQTGSVSIDNTFANQLIVVNGTANVTLTLAAASTFITGNKLAFTCKMTGSGPFWLNIVTPDTFIKGSVTRTNIWLYDGEYIEIVCAGTAWQWTIAKGNFDKIGEVELKRFQPANTFLGNGTGSLLRATYPRLWEAVSGVTVTETNFFSDPYRYRQQYTNGNTTTTLRVPDYRAMFFRALDNARGVDIGRLDNIPGGYEADKVADFSDGSFNLMLKVGVDDTGAVFDSTNPSGREPGLLDSRHLNELPGIGTETKPKNVAFNPYIYY